MAEKNERLKRLSLGPLSSYKEETTVEPDVIFVVQQFRYHTYSSILCKISPVFRAMLKGDFMTEAVISISDVSAEAFELFLKLIHFGTRTMSVVMSPKQFLDCMVVANKYMVDDLERFLKTRLLRTIDSQNVLYVFPFCNLNLNLMGIRSKCWSVIERETTRVINSEHFVTITWDFLCDILENGRLCVNELVLLLAAKRWADHQRRMSGLIHLTDKEVLGVAIYKIRFPVMTRGEFDVVKKMKLLNSGEIDDLEKNFRKNTTFPNQPRRNLCKCRKANAPCLLCVQNGKISIKGVFKDDSPSKEKTQVRVIRSPNRYGGRNRITRAPQEGRRVRMLSLEKMADANGNHIKLSPSKGKVDPGTYCECMKYKSCPAFPNGTTANILQKMGFH